MPLPNWLSLVLIACLANWTAGTQKQASHLRREVGVTANGSHHRQNIGVVDHRNASAMVVAARNASAMLIDDIEGEFNFDTNQAASAVDTERSTSPILKFGFALGYHEYFMQSGVRHHGWALAQDGALIQGWTLVDDVFDVVYFSGLLNTSLAQERFADLECYAHDWNLNADGLQQCPEGFFLSGLFSHCSDTSHFDLRCISKARCCKPQGVDAAWGACESWESGRIVSLNSRMQSAQCSSKYEAVVGIHVDSSICNQAMCLSGVKCCQPPPLGVCGDCFPYMASASAPAHCRGSICTALECCTSTLVPQAQLAQLEGYAGGSAQLAHTEMEGDSSESTFPGVIKESEMTKALPF